MVDLFCNESLPDEFTIQQFESGCMDCSRILSSYGITNFSRLDHNPNVYSGFVTSKYNSNIYDKKKCVIKFCNAEEYRITTLLSYLQYDMCVLTKERVVHVMQSSLPDPSSQLLVLKWYDGSLEDLLKTILMDKKSLTHISNCIIKGLEFIHGMGIIHSDIKAANVFVDKTYNNYVLGDFGISCDLQSAKSGKTTFVRLASAWKTHYHIPRKLFILQHGHPFGYEIDLFSYVLLVSTLYNMMIEQRSRSLLIETNIQLDVTTPRLLKNDDSVDWSFDLFIAMEYLTMKVHGILDQAVYDVDYTHYNIETILSQHLYNRF